MDLNPILRDLFANISYFLYDATVAIYTFFADLGIVL